MLSQEEQQDVYQPYSLPYYPFASASVVVDEPVTAATEPPPPVQDASQPPMFPGGPTSAPPVPPRRRPGRAGAVLLLVLVFALIFGVGLFAGWTFTSKSNTSSVGVVAKSGTTSTVSSISASTIEVQQEAAIAKVEPAVVELQVTTAQGQQLGSGVIIDAQGDIVTNAHVVNGEQRIQVLLSNGGTEQAQLVGTSTANDLAVVRIQPFAHMTIAQLGDSSALVVGQEVLAIGNPLGITQTATAGIVSALNRSVTESTGATITQTIQTDAAVNPGNSGGALINLQGQLVGIPTLSAVNTESNTVANGVSFAIPSNLVKTVVQQIVHG